jgi:hypothetical protein
MPTYLELRKLPSSHEIKQKLGQALPEYKIKSPLLNPNAVMVASGSSLVLVTRAGNRLKVAGGINTGNFGVALGTGIGVLFGIVGAFIFLGILYMTIQERFSRMEGEVARALKGEEVG